MILFFISEGDGTDAAPDRTALQRRV